VGILTPPNVPKSAKPPKTAMTPTFKQAARAYDAQEPPDDHNCKQGGHVWRKHRVAVINGEQVTEHKCRVCGETTIDV
jgi:hypothetical protein